MTPPEPHSYCPAHIELATHLAEMRSSLANIEKSLADDAGFKRGIIIAFVGIFLALIGQALYVGDRWGRLSNQVEVNTGKWSKHDDDFSSIRHDIQILKEKSYGYRDIPAVVK